MEGWRNADVMVADGIPYLYSAITVKILFVALYIKRYKII